MPTKLILILALLAALPASAQPATQPVTQPAEEQVDESQASTTQPSPQPTRPDCVVHIQKDSQVELLGFSDDGNALYLWANVVQLNIGRLLFYYWPEAVAILLVLLLLRWLRRVAGRPQFPGEEHCRHCNYLLKCLLSSRCPECGTELTPRNRVPGRRRRPRLVAASILILATAALWFFTNKHLPRQGALDNWLDWRSMHLGEWASAANIEWLNNHLDGDWVVFRAEVNQGGKLRKVCRIEDRFKSPVRSPDQKSVFGWSPVPTGKSSKRNSYGAGGGGGFGGRAFDTVDAIAQVDLSTGKITKRFPATTKQRNYINDTIHIAPQGRPRVLFCLSSGSREGGGGYEPGKVTALDIETGSILNYLDCDPNSKMHALTVGGRDITAVWTMTGFERDKAPSGSGSISGFSYNRSNCTTTTEVQAWDPVTNKILSRFSFSMRGEPWYCCDGGRFYVAGDTATGVVLETWDILTSKKLGSHHLSGPKEGRLTVRNHTLILQTPLFESYSPPEGVAEVHALNLETGEHIQLMLDVIAEPILSPDGRRMAVLSRYPKRDVCIYNLPWR